MWNPAPSLLLLALSAQAAVQVAPGITGPALHGIAELDRAVSAARFETPIAARLCPSLTKPESLSIRNTTGSGKPSLVLCGADSRGLMYAALEAAEAINAGAPAIPDTAEQPYLAERGISMYTMQRAYFESRLYDEQHWRRYFDLLARSRINSFVIIFGYENGGFLAPVYPYFFDTPGFPQIRMAGVTAAAQQRNTAAFKTMIRIAHERGIDVTAAIWDHIYRGGVQGGGIAGANDTVGRALPWLVTGVTEQNLIAYTKAALRRFLETFPEIDGLQFRMHEESGLKRTEMTSFWHDIFTLLREKHPRMLVDLRAKELPDSIIDDALAQGLNARVSTKYWMEQMGMPFHPTHTNRQDQKNRRHGYADLLRYPQRFKVHWQLWSGGTARLLLWADPEYVRRFAESARVYGGASFEVNEMLATKMLGEPHDAPPLDILNPTYRYYGYEFERYWHFYQLWGRLTYNPRTAAEVWEREFRRRFAGRAAQAMAALHVSSRVLPRIVAASYLYRNFPTTRGWAEMMTQGDLAQYAAMEGSDTEQFMNVRDRARSIVNKTDVTARTPEATAAWFDRTASEILNNTGGPAAGELFSLITDAKILAWLARFHSARLRGGVAYSLFLETGVKANLDDAIAHERNALLAWEQIVAAAGDVYRTDLAFGVERVGFPRHWRDELPKLRASLAKLESERGAPPAVELLPVAPARPGQDCVVSVKPTHASGIKSVRVRYRHLTQYEDYLAAETSPGADGVWTARIPAAFITPEWDLMYFVEVLSNDGAGAIAPDLDRETPYRIVPVLR